MSENTCPNTGSIHQTDDGLKPYTPPELCAGDLYLADPNCDTVQENYAFENLEISGATLHIFKLLGVHEQGKLVDVVGDGMAMNNSENVFSDSISTWISRERGMSVLTTPSWIGYDFGFKKTSYGMTAYENPQPNLQSISAMRITQPESTRRASQIRIERSDGNFKTDASKVHFSGSGNGKISNLLIGVKPEAGILMLIASDANTFQVFFQGQKTKTIGIAKVGSRFVCDLCAFNLESSTIPFSPGDMFSIGIEMEWVRVDVVNLPNLSNSNTIRFNKAKPSRYWRIVPTSFIGVGSNQPWEVSELELYDFELTRIDDIQDNLFMENRDRDYSKTAVDLKAAYTAFDTVTNFNKFGFDMGDTFNFTTTFAGMVKAIGRPIVVGDIVEVPSEMQYDHNLKPVRKFLEVVDTGWAADGRTTSWRPIIFKFQATPFMPSTEHRDLLGTIDTQLYAIDDSDFFAGTKNQIQTQPLVSNKINEAEAQDALPEKGANITELASGVSPHIPSVNKYDGASNYVEDGIPPDGLPYMEGYKLPEVSSAKDGDYFRLYYDPKLNISPRLYKFSLAKGKWIYMETDRRRENSSHKPSHAEMFNRTVPLKNGIRQLPKDDK
jgi:hypothetical protein